jgi:hypothetical protein
VLLIRKINCIDKTITGTADFCTFPAVLAIHRIFMRKTSLLSIYLSLTHAHAVRTERTLSLSLSLSVGEKLFVFSREEVLFLSREK